MLVRFISAGIALAAMAFGSAVCADELPAPRIRKTTRPLIRPLREQALRPAPRRTPATTSDLQAIDLGTPKRAAPLAMEGPSSAYRALERRIYGRSRENRRANIETRKTVAPRTVARRAPAVRPVDLRKTYAPEAAKAQARITASQQQAGSTRIATRSRRGSMSTVQKTRTAPKSRAAPMTIAPRAAASVPAPIEVSEPLRAPRPLDTTGAGVIPPDPAAPAIPRGPGAVRRLDVPGCLDGT